jgi:signal transduction histidine kinase
LAVQRPAIIATVAHELRGPLSALQTTSELLERDFDLLDVQQIRVMVSAMHRRTLWLRDLVENLLYAATVDDGQLKLQLRPIDLNDLFADVETLVEPIIARKQQKLRIRARSTLPIVAMGRWWARAFESRSRIGDPVSRRSSHAGSSNRINAASPKATGSGSGSPSCDRSSKRTVVA